MDALWADLGNGEVLVRLLLAVVLGGLVGLERELKGRPAGLRTHLLVCIGSTILLIAAQQALEVFAASAEGGRLVVDPNRISAGIVTGIGFLGAGAILRTGDIIRGLTTAATIWFVAALGIVIGNGAYALAIAATVLVLLIVEVFDFVEHRIPQTMYRVLYLKVDADKRAEVERWVRELFGRHGIRIQDVLCRLDMSRNEAVLTINVRARQNLWTAELLDEISAHEEIWHLEVGRV